MDSVVCPYHWDDRKKIYTDYLYIQKVYERQLEELSLQLNHIHGVDRSLRYWRILVGPWLGSFMQMLFDRWFMLKQVIEKKEASACKILDRNEGSAIPNDMGDFFQFFFKDDWNEQIYGQLIELCWNKNIHIEKVGFDVNSNQKTKIANSNWKILSKNLAKNIASYFYPLTVKDDEYFFIASYLPVRINLYLQMRLGQFPKLWEFIPPINTKPDMKKRQWRTRMGEGGDVFLELVRQMIPLHIPTAYLEGYEALVKKARNLPWPGKPKAIFTSNAHHVDDVFKVWAAAKAEEGAPLVIGQHGGHFGMAPWAFPEEHQITIADAWISWGWSNAEKPQVKPVGIFKEFGRNVRHDPDGGGLMVEATMPRYSYHMFAAPVASQWLSYFEDQCRFIAALPPALQNKVLVRFKTADYGWSQKARWWDRFPNITTDSGHQPLRTLVGKSRLCISTYNATTYLEFFSWNIPTIIFWDPEYWELREEVKPYFEQLKSVGIFHETPESAAKQMTAIWGDVAGWWESDEVQSTRSKFCTRFSHIPEKAVDELESIFNGIT